MSPEQWSSARRLAALLLVPVFGIINRKIGTDVTEQGLLVLDGLMIIGSAVYVAFSNWKEVQKDRTKTQAATAITVAVATTPVVSAIPPGPLPVVRPVVLDPPQVTR